MSSDYSDLAPASNTYHLPPPNSKSLQHNTYNLHQPVLIHKKPRRPAKACESCRKCKSRCDRGSPSCTRCFKKNSECYYQDGPVLKRARTMAESRTLNSKIDRIDGPVLALYPKSELGCSVACDDEENSVETLDFCEKTVCSLAQSYNTHINSLYPVLSKSKLDMLIGEFLAGQNLTPPFESISSALVLLVMALGKICQYKSKIPDNLCNRHSHLALGLPYFTLAADILTAQSVGNSIENVHTDVLACLYWGQLGKVQESYGYINTACCKIKAILLPKLDQFKSIDANAQISSTEDVLIIFTFWICLQLESDILSEFPYPPSEILDYEDSVPRPNLKGTEFDTRAGAGFFAQMFLRYHCRQASWPKDGRELLSRLLIDNPTLKRVMNNTRAAEDILDARLRASYFAAQVKNYRPPLHYGSTGPDKIHSIYLLVQSIKAFSELGDLSGERLVANVWGIAHVQLENISILQAAYENPTLSPLCCRLITEKDLQELLEKARSFLSVVARARAKTLSFTTSDHRRVALEALSALWAPRLFPEMASTQLLLPEDIASTLQNVHKQLTEREHVVISIIFQYFYAENLAGYEEFAFQRIDRKNVYLNKHLNALALQTQLNPYELYDSWMKAMDTCSEKITDKKYEKLADFYLACFKDKRGLDRGVLRSYNGDKDIAHSIDVLQSVIEQEIETIDAWKHALNHAIVASLGSRAQDEQGRAYSYHAAQNWISKGLKYLTDWADKCHELVEFKPLLLELSQVASELRTPEWSKIYLEESDVYLGDVGGAKMLGWDFG